MKHTKLSVADEQCLKVMTLKIGKSPAAELLGADKELIIRSLKSPQKLSHLKDDCQEAIHKIGNREK